MNEWEVREKYTQWEWEKRKFIKFADTIKFACSFPFLNTNNNCLVHDVIREQRKRK